MARLPPRVKITMTGEGRGTVSIDGVEIPCVSRIVFRASADRRDVNRLELEVACGETEIEGPAEVIMGMRDVLPTLKVKP